MNGSRLRNLERRASFLARCTRNTLAKPLDRRIFFLHFEKCGGTSVDTAIRSAYLTFMPSSLRAVISLSSEGSLAAAEALGRPLWGYRTELLHYFMSQRRVRYISGHFQIDAQLLERFRERFAFITLLRDPVERWISHYFFNRYKPGSHGRVEQAIEPYLESERGRGLGSDYVRLLLGEGDSTSAGDGRQISTQQVRRAKEQLGRFGLVGRLGELDSFTAAFEARFGTRLRIGRENTSPAPAKDVSPAVLRRIEQVCQPNLELYDYAASLL